MTLDYCYPDMVCDSCHSRVATVHDGDACVATERGWAKDNVAPDWPRVKLDDDKRREVERVEAALGLHLGTGDDLHLCPSCLSTLGIDVDDGEQWPFIGCFNYRAPAVSR